MMKDLFSKFVSRLSRACSRGRNRAGGTDGPAVLPGGDIIDSIDMTPWEHPFVTERNVARFREYSVQVWQYALEYDKRQDRPLRCAFAVNMAQNMYNWAEMSQRFGAKVELFLNPQDNTALSCPQWEEFDGEFGDVMDGETFLKAHGDIEVRVPVRRIPMDGGDLLSAYNEFHAGRRDQLLRLLAEVPSLRHEVLLQYDAFYPYYRWARKLAPFDVSYIASTPFPAYASGRPYCVSPVGGDVQFDCGRGDDYGRAMVLSFNAARFVIVSNPILGHCRRLGLANAVQLPYPVNDSRYSPGVGIARQEWESRYGSGVYVLSATRLDREVKGQDESLLKALAKLTRDHPELRFVFLSWGNSAAELTASIERLGYADNFIILKPVGKTRLIDYYRSCDIVLGHFVYGRCGAAMLEAAAVGKPVVMFLREGFYRAAYKGDPPPVANARTPAEITAALSELAANGELRLARGRQMRQWLVRHHGQDKTIPILLGLLRLAADNVPLPGDLVSPLLDELGEDEIAYHSTCLRKRPGGEGSGK